MKKLLIGLDASDIFYFQSGVRIEGAPPCVRGDLTGVRGDLTFVCGDLTHICGDLSHIRGDLTFVCGDLTHICGDLTFVRGDLTGVRGDLTFVRGDLDKCEITQEDRAKGIRIEELIEEDPRITEEDNQYKNNL